MKRSIVDYVAEHAARTPERPAFFCRDGAVTYGGLEALAARMRGALAARGVRPGDRVALVMSDSPDMAAAYLGILGLAAIAVPCSTQLPPEGLAYVFRDSGAKLVIASPEHLAAADAARAPGLVAPGFARDAAPAPLAAFDRDTPCLILYTSGSTGDPKGALHLHGHLPVAAEGVGGKIYALQPEDRLFSAARMFFAYGLGNSFSVPLASGCSAVLLGERPTPALIAETLARHRPTVFFAVPTVFRMLIEHARQGNPLDTASLRFSVSAGEVLPLSTWNEWKALTGHEILESVGSTELLYAFLHNRRGDNRPGSAGKPVEGYDIRLCDEQGSDVDGPGHGAIHVRGGTAIPRYWNKPERSAETIRDGWIRTGDLFRRDEDGFYWFEGRADDLFKCSGMWVSPGDVEGAVMKHPAVMEAAVIAEADASGATIPAAYVQLRPGNAASALLSEEIKDVAAKSLPRFKRPHRVHFIDELPRTATGKVQRFKLRQLSRRA